MHIPNYLGYLILILISIAVFIFSLWEKRDFKRLFILYLFISGLTYLAEYFIMTWFNSYIYYPRIFKERYLDSIAGAVVSDAFSVPMLTVFVASFLLSTADFILLKSHMLIITKGWSIFYFIIWRIAVFFMIKWLDNLLFKELEERTPPLIA
jgi:hypothetical protein